MKDTLIFSFFCILPLLGGDRDTDSDTDRDSGNGSNPTPAPAKEWGDINSARRERRMAEAVRAAQAKRRREVVHELAFRAKSFNEELQKFAVAIDDSERDNGRLEKYSSRKRVGRPARKRDAVNGKGPARKRTRTQLEPHSRVGGDSGADDPAVFVLTDDDDEDEDGDDAFEPRIVWLCTGLGYARSTKVDLLASSSFRFGLYMKFGDDEKTELPVIRVQRQPCVEIVSAADQAENASIRRRLNDFLRQTDVLVGMKRSPDVLPKAKSNGETEW